MVNDFELIDRIIDGNQAAINLLIDRHKRYAYTIAFRILQNEEDAEEAAQDSFVKALNSLRNFNKKSKFTTWFYRIICNVSISYRRKKRITTQSIDHVQHAILDVTYNVNPEQLNDQKHFINEAIRSLKIDDQLVLTLFYLNELSLQEVAETLNISVNTTKIKVHRARKRMALALIKILNGEEKELL